MNYAKNTSVPIDRSQAEIKKIISKYKATSFVYGETDASAVVMFEMANRRIKLTLPMPQKPSAHATQASIKTYDQLCRASWRCLVLAIKAKLECVESKISTFEQEFMAHIVLPNGKTIGQVILPQIDQSYKDGKMPPLLGYGG